MRAAAVAVGLACAVAAPARAACYLAQLAAFPAHVEGGLPVIQADVDGKKVEFVIDTGAPFSEISSRTARLLGINVYDAVNGGRPTANIASLYFGHSTLTNVSVMVVDQTSQDGRLGRDVLADYDVDVDLAHNVVRLLRTSGCSDAQMVYWGGKTFSEAPLQPRNSFLDDYKTVLRLDGRDVLALLDTGAPDTVVSAGAARAAGIEAVGADTASGTPSRLFATVALGDETVRNARLRVVDLAAYRDVYDGDHPADAVYGQADYGLIGDDFFRSHHVLISPSHRKLFFTYEGGPAFAPVTPAAAGR